MTPCTCHPGETCASSASCAAARKTEFGEKMSTEQKLREALEELLYAHTDKAVAMARAALSLPATEQASATTAREIAAQCWCDAGETADYRALQELQWVRNARALGNVGV